MRTLFVDMPGSTDATPDRVYDQTIAFLKQKIGNASNHQFFDTKSLIDAVKAADVSVVIAPGRLQLDSALELNAVGAVLVVIGPHPAHDDVCDICIDPLFVSRSMHCTGPAYLLPSIVKDLGIDCVAHAIGMDAVTLHREVDENLSERDLVEVVSLFSRLRWDSDFFGANVGYIKCLRLTPNIEKQVKKFTAKENIDLLEYLCNCHDKISIVTAEKAGYSFVDIRLTFQRELSGPIPIEHHSEYTIRRAIKEDIPLLRSIAHDIYRDSRYYFDGNFDVSKVIEFFESWVEKGVLGTFDDYVTVLEHDGKLVGFCTIKRQRKRLAKIGLSGLEQCERGKGSGVYLLNDVLSELKRDGVEAVNVVTQGRNYAAQRLYQKCGFLTLKTELWYHKWFR